MDHFLYISMNAAKNAMQAQQTNANNLANASTTAFKADLDHFESLPVYGPGHASRAYANDERAGVDMSGGATLHTGRDLDLRVNGEGWIVVQADDGSEALTRRGDLQLDETGFLHTGAGQLVIGQGGPIVVPEHESLVIGRDGTISIRGAGQEANALTAIDKIKLVNPNQNSIQRGDNGLFKSKTGEAFEVDTNVSVTGGALEGSNVNIVDSMVKMMEYARFYETQIKMLNVANENDQSSSKLMSMS